MHNTTILMTGSENTEIKYGNHPFDFGLNFGTKNYDIIDH